MPTPSRTFAAVAHALADVDPADRSAVAMFYRETFLSYSMPIRSLISDFLVGQTGEPSAMDLATLVAAVSGPLDEIPEVEAPAWRGPAMEHLPDADQKTAAAE